MIPHSEIEAYRKLVGSWIKSIREDAGLSKNELSKRTGIDRKYLNMIESGDTSVSLDIIAKLSFALNFFIFFIPKKSSDPLAETMRKRWGKYEDN